MKKKIIIFCSVAYAVTWIIAFGIYIGFKNDLLTSYQLNLLHSFAAFGPAISALLTAYLFYGRIGIKKILIKLKPKIVNKKLFPVVLSPLIFFVIGLLIYRIYTNEWFDFKLFFNTNWADTKNFIVWILPSITFAVCEEIGWRGFLLPHLQNEYIAWKSTIYLTIIWSLWHLPFFFYRFEFSVFMAIGFLIGLFVGSIILTSIYNSNKGFLTSVIIFHFLNNICSMFDKQFIGTVLSMGFVFIAIYTYKKLGKENLSTSSRTKNYFLL